MRALLLILILLALAIQYPLWWGKGGWLRVKELQQQMAAQQETNDALMARNNALAAEVQDLKSGTSAIEERARGELGMVMQDEIFVQILPSDEHKPAITTPRLPTPAEKKGN